MNFNFCHDTWFRSFNLRVFAFSFLFQCRYSGTFVEALVVEVNTVPPPLPVVSPVPLKVELRLANGQCFAKVCVEDKSSFSCRPFEMGLELNVSCLPCAEDQAAYSYYDSAEYPVTSPAGASLLKCTFEQTDPNIVLTLDLCWASSNPDPQSLPQWDLVHG